MGKKEIEKHPNLPLKGDGGSEFDEIRPFAEGEIKQAVESLLADRQFSRMLKGFVPWMPQWMRNGLIRLAFVGVNTPLQFQLRFIKPVLKHILRKCSTGYTFAYSGIAPGPERYTFISNHRDIVLDSAILDLMLHENYFPTTCEIAIGDNLLIYPWIKTLVKLNKAFTVKRGLSPRELLESSQRMSRYMHYAIQEKHENIWIAQREGRAKDSSDQTQESLLKMFAMTGEGTIIDRLKELNLVPLSISYEYDPCDYLKAQEMQLKRDNPRWRKRAKDDVLSMKTGIKGWKGHVVYRLTPSINHDIDRMLEKHPDYRGLPIKEQIDHLCFIIDQHIFLGYELFERGTDFDAYITSRVDKVEVPQKDEAYLKERLYEMYNNPVINHQKAEKYYDKSNIPGLV